ncbi:MAG: Uncharacterised protein [Bacteroidetes bacterium MED-G17]|nr:MAG: Uncharacterised protein [Bacteroidetes bacterium MED-G17]
MSFVIFSSLVPGSSSVFLSCSSTVPGNSLGTTAPATNKPAPAIAAAARGFDAANLAIVAAILGINFPTIAINVVIIPPKPVANIRNAPNIAGHVTFKKLPIASSFPSFLGSLIQSTILWRIFPIKIVPINLKIRLNNPSTGLRIFLATFARPLNIPDSSLSSLLFLFDLSPFLLS